MNNGRPVFGGVLVLAILLAGSHRALAENNPPQPKALPLPAEDSADSVNRPALPEETLAPKTLTVGWQYKPYAAHYLNQMLSEYQTHHERFPGNAEANQLALKAFQQATYQTPLTQWGLQSAVHPWVIQPSITLTNPTETAWLDVTVTVEIDIHRGELRVDGNLFLTDLDYLSQSAQWETYRQSRQVVSVLAPGDTQAVTVAPIELLPLITPNQSTPNSDRALSDRWPESIRLRVWLTPAQKELPAEQHFGETELKLYPDYFLTPFHPLRSQ